MPSKKKELGIDPYKDEKNTRKLVKAEYEYGKLYSDKSHKILEDNKEGLIDHCKTKYNDDIIEPELHAACLDETEKLYKKDINKFEHLKKVMTASNPYYPPLLNNKKNKNNKKPKNN